MTYFVIEDFSAAAGDGVQSRIAQAHDGVAHAQVAVFSNSKDFGCREAVHPYLRKALLDALEEALEPFDLEVRMQTALHQHTRATHLDGLSDFLVDRLEVENVAFCSHLASEWAIEGTEGAVLGAEVGVVDVAVDDVGHHALRVQLSAHGVGLHAKTDEVIGMEVIEGLLACDRHTLILEGSGPTFQTCSRGSQHMRASAPEYMRYDVQESLFILPCSAIASEIVARSQDLCFAVDISTGAKVRMLNPPRRSARLAALPLVAILILFTSAKSLFAADDKPQPDVIVFTNGDQLSGKFVRAIGDTVTFHSDLVGDISIAWSKIKELRTGQKLAVIGNNVQIKNRQIPASVPIGTVSVADQQITVQSATNATIAPIPVKSAHFVIDEATLNKEVKGHPGFFQAWNGAATAGLTLVQATQDQYSFNGAVALARLVPTVSWLDPRNRTTINYAQSYGKITDPGYTAADGTVVPSSFTKSSIFHADAERDQYVSPRFYFLGQVSFDHNYSQSLDLQQIYGGGIGYTLIKTPKQELDVKATVQYERQAFFNTTTNENQDLIGSTFGGYYTLHFPKSILFAQQLLYIPAWNNTRAYSVAETDSFTFPAYKNIGFSLGTLDTYLNDVPMTFPPTKRNSFQFTAGVTYTIKSSY